MHRVLAHSIAPERRFDLSHYLSRRYGDEFAPRPRLWNADRRNFGEVNGLLDKKAQELAWERGNYAAVLGSVTAGVEAIARLFDRARAEKFISGEGGPYQGADSNTLSTSTGQLSHTVIRPTRLPSSPGPYVRLHRELLDPSRLTARHQALLAELLRLRAFDRPSCVTTGELAVAVDGPGAREASFKHPVSELRRWECVETAEGRGGGVWLTGTGRVIAEGDGT
ncbi:hypothetical protein R5W23_001452 [Gemmata sp. JC673]|uniref:Uncharacterized protein n=1 Tax=Gemmata algarum TaxID=2975278 RepID=A0ABU5EY38_9BACT|nr:hypothetical protein [Gemmata algarum]MDY3560226.1 hypothetical protein [Gemmata algarum]